MNRILAVMIVLFFLAGCSSAKVKIINGLQIHEGLYQLPVLNDETWIRVIPADTADAMYFRCPGNQGIFVFQTMLCRKFDHTTMNPDDYVKRVYTNSYFSFWDNQLCPSQISPLTDKNFKKMIGKPTVNSVNKSFSIVYETELESLCKTTEKLIPMKVMDVFIENPKSEFSGGMHSKFVVFRYVSTLEQFETGLADFKNLVSKFQWIEQKEK